MEIGLVLLYCCAIICSAAIIIYLLDKYIIKSPPNVQKGVFIVRGSEANGNWIFVERIPEAGGFISFRDMTDQEFINKVVVIRNGNVCTNNHTSVEHQGSDNFEFDVARRKNRPWELFFSRNMLERNDVVQVIIYR